MGRPPNDDPHLRERQDDRDFGGPSLGAMLLLFALAVLMLALVGALTGCATAAPSPDTKAYYRHDMDVTVNAERFVGAGVALRAPKYRVRVESYTDMDLLTISTCSRDVPIPNAIKVGWFGGKHGYEFDFVPNKREVEDGCPLKLGGYNEARGQHSWALIDFEGPKYRLPAGISCNGDAEIRADGVGVCQSHEGLEQEIRFLVPVIKSDVARSAPACEISASKDGGRTFVFRTPPGECVFTFIEIGPKAQLFRLRTIGYDRTIIRSTED